MLNLSWKVFLNTGNIETYLLYKELQSEEQLMTSNNSQVQSSLELPNS